MKFNRPRRFTVVSLSVILLSLFTTFYKSDSISSKGNSAAVVPNIQINKAGTLDTSAGGDLNVNGVINPGDRVNYSITVSNAGTDALNVIVKDILDSNLTLVPGSVNSSPIAVNDSFNALGNAAMNVPAASGVKINDFDPDATTPSITGFGNSLANANATAAGGNGTSAQGGNVTLQADGSFSYNPPAGYEGTDSFFYTLRDGGADGTANNSDDATNTAQVTLTVSGMIWFINNNSAGCTTRASGCGRLSNPYSSLASFQAENNGTGNNPAAGDNVFIYTGNSSYDASVTLLNNQKLIGQGANTALTGAGSITNLTPPLFSATLPTTGGTNPTIITTAAAANAVSLGQGNTIRGLTIGNTTGAKISGTNFGTVNFGPAGGNSDLTLNGTGQALNLNTGTIAGAGFASTTSTSGTNSISLLNLSGTLNLGGGALSGFTGQSFVIGSAGANTGGNVTVNYSGTITSQSGSSNVVAIRNKTGGTVAFTGAISGTHAGTGVLLTGNTGATITFSGGLNLSTSSGNAFDATGGGTIEVCDKNPCGVGGAVVNTLATTSERALNVQNTTIGLNGLTFRSISTSGGGSSTAVFVQNTGTSAAGLKVTGTGSTAGSGGTIANIAGGDVGSIAGVPTTGTGIYLGNVANVSLSNMIIGANGGTMTNFGIRGDNVNNFTLRDSEFRGVFGDNFGFDEGTIRFGSQNVTTGLIGTALFEGNVIAGAEEDNLGVYVYGANTLNITVKDSANDQAVFNNNGTTNGNDGFFLESGGTSNVTVLVEGVAFNGARGDLLQTIAIDSTQQDTIVRNNAFHNAHTNIVSGGGGITFSGGGTNIDVDYLVNNNTFKGMRASAIFSSFGGVSGNISALVTNNTQGTANGAYDTLQANRGSMEGMFFFGGIDAKQLGSTGNVNYALRIEGNTIRDVNGIAGILLRSNQQDSGGQSRVEATIHNNTMAEMGSNIAGGIYMQPGGASLNNDKGTMGANISNNNINFTVGGASASGDAVVFDQAGIPSTFYMPSYTSAPSANPNTLANFLKATKGNVFTNAAVSGTGGVLANTSAVNNQAFVLTVPVASLFVEDEFAPSQTKNGSQFLALNESSEIFEITPGSTLIQSTPDAQLAQAGADEKVSSARQIDPTANMLTASADLIGKLYHAVFPTAHAEESETSMFMAGETVCVDGNTDPNNCSGGFSIPANESTTITFTVTVASNFTGSSIPNTASVTATGISTQNSNQVNTTVVQPATITKAFGSSSISFGSTTTLTFSVGNPNPSTNLTNIAFTDNLPAGLVVANPNGLVNNCGGTVTAVQDSTSISVSALSRNAATNCTIVVNVKATSVGEKQNITGTITSTQGGTGLTASANLTVTNPTVSGVVSYGIAQMNQPQKFVSSVQVSATGASTVSATTDASGGYLLENLTPNGQYTVIPTKSGNANGITAFDAVLVLRCVAAGASCTLSNQQKRAADTDLDPNITSFDATQILRYVAANGANANTGSVGNWRFNPGSTNYNPLTGSFSGQDYEAALIGDIDGDWTP